MALKDLLHLLPLISVANSLLFEPPSSNRHISVQKPNQIEKRAPAGSNFVNIGCYVDTINPRSLPAYSTSSDGMSNEYCQTLCDARGYSIAGTQWARECWCDVKINQELRTRDNECDMICTGAAETCGGSARLTVWQNQGTVTDPDSLVYGEWQGIGCFIDQIGNRALPHQVYVDGDMTIEKCTSQCFNEGYTVAGAEFANECFCAFGISSPKADDRGCDMSCSGNPAEICGGGNRITVYRYNPPPTSSSVSTGTSTSIGPGSTETESPTMTETTSTSTSTPTSTVLPAGPYRVQVVRSADNSLLGYIAQENGPFVLPTYTTDPTAALLVESEVPKQMPQGGTCTELRELNPPDALYPYLAAYYATTNYNINSAVSQTPAGSTKQPTGTTRSPAAMGESCIWRLDPITLGLSQFWVEDDATTITDRHLYYFGSGTTGYFMSARNPVTFEAIFPTAFPVHFVLQQVSP